MMVMKDKNDCKGSWDLASGFVYVLIYFFALFFFFPGGARYFTKALISQYLKQSTENPV